MIEIKYVSSNGREYSLIGDKMRATNGSMHKYAWNKDVTELIYGDEVNTFKKRSVTYSMTLTFRGELSARKAFMNELTDAFENDIVSKVPGRIYYGDYYIKCYIISSESGISETWNNWTVKKIDIYCPKSFWIKESTKSFLPANKGTDYLYLDYPYDYDHDYSPDVMPVEYINLEHYASCDYLLKIYGPAIDPAVTIGGIVRQVYTTLEAGQSLLIDSRDKTVKRVFSDGAILNEFNNRRRGTRSIFEPIMPGLNEIIWNNAFGFDLTLFIARSEPAWR